MPSPTPEHADTQVYDRFNWIISITAAIIGYTSIFDRYIRRTDKVVQPIPQNESRSHLRLDEKSNRIGEVKPVPKILRTF